MPRRDLYHNTVKTALLKDGWTITHDPLVLGEPGFQVYPDFGCEKASGDRRSLLAIEVKVFGARGQISELQKAIGQYVLYRSILRHRSDNRVLYLALSHAIHQTLFQKQIVRDVVRDEAIHLVIFNPNTEEIEQWID